MRTCLFFAYLSFWGCLLSFLLSSCSTLEHGPLSEQELRFRPEGLTHRICRQEFNDVCFEYSTIIYSFQNPEHLKRLRDVKLICKVGDRRFYVCPDKSALCSNFEEIKTFLGVPYSTELQSEVLYVPEDLQTLIDANAYCAAQGSVSENGMF
jgi:hypothetical protein